MSKLQARQVWITLNNMDARWKYYPNRSKEITKEQFDAECIVGRFFSDTEWKAHKEIKHV